MKTFPTLHTPRLTLGQLEISDIPMIIEYANNPNVSKMLRTMPYPYAEKDAIFWLNMIHQGWSDESMCIFGIRSQETKQFIGGVGLHINKSFSRGELGYWIGEPHWGKGYMSEALRAIIKYGFEEKKLHKIYAIHFLDNPASGKVMMKNGMVKEGEMKEHVKNRDGYKDVALYGLTQKLYKERLILS